MSVGRKKSFEVLPMKPNLEGIGVNGKMYKFGKHKNDTKIFTTHDAGLAQDIEQMYGSHSKTGNRDVVVCEVDNAQGRTPRRVFSIRCPWKDE